MIYKVWMDTGGKYIKIEARRCCCYSIIIDWGEQKGHICRAYRRCGVQIQRA